MSTGTEGVADDPQVIGFKEQTAVLGGVLWLCQFSELHANYPAGLLLERVLPSIELDQFRYYEDDRGAPVAFCNWALLSEEILARALRGEDRFRREDWRSGPCRFFPELIAPFGHCRRVIRDLRRNIVAPNERTWSTRGLVTGEGDKGRPRVQRFCNVQGLVRETPPDA